MKFVPWKDYKAITADLKLIYGSVTEEHALLEMDKFSERKLFPSDDAAKKVIYLAIQEASKKWTMPIRNWKQALNRFMIEFEDWLTDFV